MGINTIEIFPRKRMVVVEDFVGGGFYSGSGPINFANSALEN